MPMMNEAFEMLLTMMMGVVFEMLAGRGEVISMMNGRSVRDALDDDDEHSVLGT